MPDAPPLKHLITQVVPDEPLLTGPGRDAGQPVFYFDLAHPDAYLAAERVMAALPVVPEWEPVRLAALPGGGALEAFRCAGERDIWMVEVERRAAAHGVQSLRWPATWPPEGDIAMRAATYAKSIGRVVAFSLAAFRQAFAGGRDLGNPENVLIAAAACEMHPQAVLAGVKLRSVAAALERATAAAVNAGVTTVPAIAVDGTVFEGDHAVEDAAAALAGART